MIPHPAHLGFHPAALDLELCAGLRARWDFQRDKTLKGLHIQAPALDCSGKIDFLFAVNDVPFPSELGVGLDIDLNIKIPVGSAARGRLSLARQADLLPLLDACRDLDCNGLLMGMHACSMAFLARVGDPGSCAHAFRAGTGKAECALGHEITACSAATGTRLLFAPWFSARSSAPVALGVFCDPQGVISPLGCGLKRNGNRCLNIRTAGWPWASPPGLFVSSAEDVEKVAKPPQSAEKIPQIIRIEVKPLFPAIPLRSGSIHPSIGIFAHEIVLLPLVVIREDLVRLVDLLEPFLSLFASLAFVRMVLNSEFPERLLDLVLVGVLAHSQDFIKVF